MRMRGQFYSELDAPPSHLVEGAGYELDLRIVGSASGTPAQGEFEMGTAHRLQEIACKRHIVVNDGGKLRLIYEGHGHSASVACQPLRIGEEMKSSGATDHRDASRIEQLLELLGFGDPFEPGRLGAFDALQA